LAKVLAANGPDNFGYGINVRGGLYRKLGGNPLDKRRACFRYSYQRYRRPWRQRINLLNGIVNGG
jgi:hypothetical protein